MEAVLWYTAFEGLDAITRRVTVTNRGAAPCTVKRLFSASLDFPREGYDLVQLCGGWADERHVERRPLSRAVTCVQSGRGISSHEHNPLIALCSPDATEYSGDVYGFNLVYSGSFAAVAEVDNQPSVRVLMGLNPENFSWRLEPGERFETPEAVLVYLNRFSKNGQWTKRPLCRKIDLYRGCSYVQEQIHTSASVRGRNTGYAGDGIDTARDSRGKIELARKTILKMLDEGEKISVPKLIGKTGLSRGFFYKNPTIRRLLDEALEKQVGMPDPRRAVLDRADSQLLKLHEMIRSLVRENQRLVEENQKLKKALDKRNANQFHRI